MSPLRSIAFKLSVLASLCVLVAIALMARQISSTIEDGLIAEMKVRAQFFARESGEAIFPKRDAFSLHFHVQEMLKERAVTYAAVVDNKGRVLSHTRTELIGTVPDDPFSVDVLHSNDVELRRTRSRDARVSYDVSAPIRIGARRIGTARLGFDSSSLDAALRAPRTRILKIAAAATALAIGGTILIVGWITRPLPMLAAAAREAGKGNFGVRVEARSNDEIGVLASAFNEMTTANAVLFRRLGEEKEKLSGIFEGTREGMVLTDARGRIALLNPSARALLGLHDAKPETLREALGGDYVPNPELDAVFKSRERVTAVQFERREPKLLILSGVVDMLGEEASPAGFLFIFHDATLEKRGEVLSRSFLSLVTHKLRTPLAVALGYLEIMRGEGKNLTKDQQKVLTTVSTENEKLRRLVEKLIAFSAVQSPESIILDRIESGLDEVVDSAIKALPPEIAESASLRWDPPALARLPKVRLDRMMMKEVVANLIENAVKFNRASEKIVTISAERAGDAVRVSVEDNGPGIPGEEQVKLFRKFYQIDVHFTGQIPGFGLGLAFAKNVVEAHGGSVGLRSAPGQGSEFYFTLPV